MFRTPSRQSPCLLPHAPSSPAARFISSRARGFAAGLSAAACVLAFAPTGHGAQDAAAGAAPAAAAAPASAQPTLPPPEPTAEVRAIFTERLSRSFAQRARNLLQRDRVYLGMLESSEALLRISTELAPDNPFIWRIALDLATTMEDGDPTAVALSKEALKRLNELDPGNEVIRLRRILDTISVRQTAEERLAIYNRLLEPQSVAQIGNVVAARLAFDAAVLLRRTGDIAGFEEYLLRAVDLDPSFPEATEIAAGYFRMRAPSRVEDAQAMRVALIANPIRTPAALGLASLCLENGAYRSAAQILDVEAEILATPRPDPVFDGVLTDLAVAFWGSDQLEKAFLLLSRRQRMLDESLMEELDRSGAILSVEERAQVRMPIAPQLAATFAAITQARGSESREAALSNCAFSYETQMQSLERLLEDPERSDLDKTRLKEELASARLQGAIVLLWLGGDAAKAATWIDQAQAQMPLSDDARARFEGWILFRKGEKDKAREIFERIAPNDTSARLGLAILLDETGDKKGAARAYLEVARAMPQTAMGVWAREKLQGILGQRVELFAEAAQIDAAASLPPEFLELMRDGSRKVLLRIAPRVTGARPWDQLIFDVELTNLSEWPLAISPEGPLADTMTVTAAVHVPGRMPGVPPFAIVAIDRQLVLRPKQTLRIPFDASLTDASVALRDDPIVGAFLSLHGILNWRTTQEGLEPGPLGVEVASSEVHVSGARLTREWVVERLAELADTSKVPDPETIALLAHAHRRTVREGDNADPGIREALAGSGPALADAAKRLWPEARAWLAFAAPHAPAIERREVQSATAAAAQEAELAMLSAPVPELEPLMAVLREDEAYLPRLAWISVRSTRPEDPVLEATLKSPDERLAGFAKVYQSWLLSVQDERRRELNLQ
jgi:tetratricopeptide (TPR) repeat protein